MPAKTIVISFLFLIVVLVAAAFAITGNQPAQPAEASFTSVEIEKTIEDVGEIKVSDIIIRDFEFKNSGEKPLQILDINSSCGCTTGKVIYKDFESREYGMHARSGYVTEVAPGETAVLRLTYRPATMPVYGLVQREVYLTTNSAEKPKITFAIKAIVRE